MSSEKIVLFHFEKGTKQKQMSREDHRDKKRTKCIEIKIIILLLLFWKSDTLTNEGLVFFP